MQKEAEDILALGHICSKCAEELGAMPDSVFGYYAPCKRCNKRAILQHPSYWDWPKYPEIAECRDL